MAKQIINIGTAPNDGTGDPIRDAFSKVNDNFTEIYSSYAASGTITTGNSSVNTTVSGASGVIVSNSAVSTVANTSTLKVGNSSVNATITAISMSVNGNTTLGDAIVNTTAITVGNSTVNSTHSSTVLSINAATLSASINTSGLFVGNSTANISANTTRLNVREANVSTNNFNMGSYFAGSTNFANGYTRLPNGLLMQWGYIAAVNSTANLTTFSSVGGVSFTNVFSVTVTPSSTNSYPVSVTLANATHLILLANNCTGANQTGVYWMAIGK